MEEGRKRGEGDSPYSDFLTSKPAYEAKA